MTSQKGKFLYTQAKKLYCIALYCIALYFVVFHCIVLHCIVLYCIALYFVVLYCIALHCIALHCYVLHCIVLHCINPPKRVWGCPTGGARKQKVTRRTIPLTYLTECTVLSLYSCIHTHRVTSRVVS